MLRETVKEATRRTASKIGTMTQLLLRQLLSQTYNENYGNYVTYCGLIADSKWYVKYADGPLVQVQSRTYKI